MLLASQKKLLSQEPGAFPPQQNICFSYPLQSPGETMFDQEVLGRKSEAAWQCQGVNQRNWGRKRERLKQKRTKHQIARALCMGKIIIKKIWCIHQKTNTISRQDVWPGECGGRAKHLLGDKSFERANWAAYPCWQLSKVSAIRQWCKYKVTRKEKSNLNFKHRMQISKISI